MEKTLSDPALSKALDEIKKSNAEISKAFFFEKGKIIAKDKYLKEEEGKKTVAAFEEISGRANVISGVQSITIQGANGRVDITRINNCFLTTVASKKATDENLNNLTRVLAPSLLKQIEKATPNKKQAIETIAQNNLDQKQTVEVKPSQSLEKTEPNMDLTNAGFKEFTVDNLGRLSAISASQDTVRLDMITVGRWTELYGENKIHKVHVKSLKNGKTVICGFEEINDSNNERRDLVLIPEMIQQILQIKKGATVLIKPVTDQESPEKLVEAPTVAPQPEEQTNKRSFQPDLPACQLIVEDLSGFGSLLGNDVVRFDEGLVERWKEFYDQKKIDEVIINDILLGKSVQCKFKILRDSEFKGKGRVQIPKWIQQKLAIKEGSLVTIKPVVK